MTDATVIKKSKNPKAPKVFPGELTISCLPRFRARTPSRSWANRGLAGQFRRQLAKRMLTAEMSHHPEAGTEQGKAGNHRYGTRTKTFLTPQRRTEAGYSA
ncbi:Transposase [Burkholderia cenocepacia PC184]|nr:Transposase [Burkholderia cenocepacia PC184]